MLAHCPMCQSAYEPSEIRLIGEKGTTRLFHCTCGSCKHAVLAVVLEAAGSTSSVGLMTDMELQDALRFQQAGPVTTDECIAFHQLLETKSQAVCQALLDRKA